MRRQIAFNPHRTVFGQDFFGRKEEINILSKRLTHGQSVLITGERRIGKTSLLSHVHRVQNIFSKDTPQIWLGSFYPTTLPELANEIHGLLFEQEIITSPPKISKDEKNILVALFATRMGARRVVASITRAAYLPLVYQIGVDVAISSSLIAVNKTLQHIRRGKIANVVTLLEDQAEVIEIEALETSDLINKCLKSLQLPKGVLVGAIFRGEELLIPNGETIIVPGDKVAMVVASSAMKQVEKMVMVKPEYW